MARFVRVHASTKGGYSSEFDGVPRRRRDAFDCMPKRRVAGTGHTHGSSAFNEAVSKSMRAADRVRSNAYQRHVDFMKHYVHNYGDENLKKYTCLSGDGVKTDWDVLAEEHRFVRTPAEDKLAKKNWGKRLAKRYYDKLFKEYALADMKLYKKGRVGLRWRTQKEVIGGKGQFECGNLKCTEPDGLDSFEVNFAYKEGNPPQRKNALVKLRLCPGCAYKLNYKKMKSEKKRAKKQLRKDLRREKRRRKPGIQNPAQKATKRRKQENGGDASVAHASDAPTAGAGTASKVSGVKAAAARATTDESGTASSIWSAPKTKEKDEMDIFLDSLMP